MTERFWAIRPGRPEEREVAFIFDTWQKAVGRSLRRQERGPDYHRAQKRVIASLIQSAEVVVACMPNDPDTEGDESATILGYMVGEPGRPTLIHMAYTKRAYRGAGVQRSLLRYLLDGRDPQQEGVVVTEVPDAQIGKLIRRKGWGRAQRLPYYTAIMAAEAENDNARVRAEAKQETTT